MNVIEEIAAERQRQIEAEGWTREHDDEAHDIGEMAQAAACYAAHPYWMVSTIDLFWPWEKEWWKPKDRRRDLIRAGALIVAEIERLDRVTDKGGRQAMLGKHKFKVGQRVRLSAEGKAALISTRKPDAGGVVTNVDGFNSPTVKWDHRKTTSSYAPWFIEPDWRRLSTSERVAKRIASWSKAKKNLGRRLADKGR